MNSSIRTSTLCGRETHIILHARGCGKSVRWSQVIVECRNININRACARSQKMDRKLVNRACVSAASTTPPSLSMFQTVIDASQIKVVEADASELNVPLIAPFTIASSRLEYVGNVSLRIELEDGSVGWGETPILRAVTAEDQPTALAKALQVCSLLKLTPTMSCRKVLEKICDLLPGHEFASVRAGYEMAVLDAVAHSANMPLWRLFGGHSDTVLTDITIPITSAEEAGLLASEYASRGFNMIKTKVGGRDLKDDIKMLRAIRSSHPTCSLILDANGGYNANESLDVLKQLHELGLTPALFEQPVPRDDWIGLGHVTCEAHDKFGVLIAADESCRSIDDVTRIINGGLADVVNIKLSKIGVLASLEVATMVQQAGLGLMIGGMVETRLAMGFAAHMAAGLGLFRFIDLDTPLLLAKDPVQGGYHAEGPLYRLGNTPGHGGSLPWPQH